MNGVRARFSPAALSLQLSTGTRFGIRDLPNQMTDQLWQGEGHYVKAWECCLGRPPVAGLAPVAYACRRPPLTRLDAAGPGPSSPKPRSNMRCRCLLSLATFHLNPPSLVGCCQAPAPPLGRLMWAPPHELCLATALAATRGIEVEEWLQGVVAGAIRRSPAWPHGGFVGGV
jgi:hypothetical protein